MQSQDYSFRSRVLFLAPWLCSPKPELEGMLSLTGERHASYPTPGQLNTPPLPMRPAAGCLLSSPAPGHWGPGSFILSGGRHQDRAFPPAPAKYLEDLETGLGANCTWPDNSLETTWGKSVPLSEMQFICLENRNINPYLMRLLLSIKCGQAPESTRHIVSVQ